MLVGRDGRPRVTDFGLAFLTEETDAATDRGATRTLAEAGETAALSSAEADLTRTGALLGTPAYMAPEQLAGAAPDARSDQFSYCVALYEAVHGERPFTARTLAGLHEAIAAGPRPPTKRGPAWLERALARGLRPAPADRFATMDALLAALAGPPVRRRRAAILAGVAALAITAGAVWTGSTRPDDDACGDPAAQLAGVWDAAREQQLASAFAATRLPYADDALRRVHERFAAHAAAWTREWSTLCRAQLRDELPPAELAARSGCLGARRAELAALVERLVRVEASTLPHAISAAHALLDPSECATQARPEPAVEPALRERIAGSLAAARALQSLGRPQEALARARDATAAAESAGDPGLLADALATRGMLEFAAHGVEAAEPTLRAAVAAAEAAGDDRLRAIALVSLIQVLAQLPGRLDEAAGLVQMAEGAIARSKNPGLLAAYLHYTLGVLASGRGHHDDALEHLEQALSQFERSVAADDVRLAYVSGLTGFALGRVGRDDEARALLQDTLVWSEHVFGDHHPELAGLLEDLALEECLLGDPERAIVLADRGRALLVAAFGPDDRRLATLWQAIGRGESLAGRHARAIAAMTEAVRLAASADPGDPAHADALVQLAGAHAAAGQDDVALTHLRAAVAIVEAALGTRDIRLAQPLTRLGAAHLVRGETDDAIAALGRAEALHTLHTTTPLGAAETRFTLARALWAGGRAPTRALALASAAAGAYAAGGAAHAAAHVEVATWLAARARPDG